MIKAFQLLGVELGIGSVTQITEVGKAEAFSIFYLLLKIRVLLPEVEEGIHVSFVGLVKVIADVAGLVLLPYPGTDGISALGVFLEQTLGGHFPGLKA